MWLLTLSQLLAELEQVALRQALPSPALKPPAAPLEMTVTERGKKSKKPPV